MSLYEQKKKQRLQLRLDKVGELPTPQPATVDNLHETVQKAYKIMLPFAEIYQKGETSVQELKKMFKDKLSELGFKNKAQLKPRLQLKRPATENVNDGDTIKSPNSAKKKKKDVQSPHTKPPTTANSSGSDTPPVGSKKRPRYNTRRKQDFSTIPIGLGESALEALEKMGFS